VVRRLVACASAMPGRARGRHPPDVAAACGLAASRPDRSLGDPRRAPSLKRWGGPGPEIAPRTKLLPVPPLQLLLFLPCSSRSPITVRQRERRAPGRIGQVAAGPDQLPKA
jgi:hypothetical protein